MVQFGLVYLIGFSDISSLVGWLGFMAYQPLEVILRQIHFYENSSISIIQFSMSLIV